MKRPVETPSLLSGGPGAGLYQARALLGMCHQGLRDLKESDADRVRLGFCGLVVVGRSVTLAMENLRSVEGLGFDDSYAPWAAEMKADPLLRFFNQLRRDIVHLTPSIGVVLVSYGPDAALPGTVTLDRPLPNMHRGQPLTDTAIEHLCGLYVDYLEEMFTSLAPRVFEAEDRYIAAQIAKQGQSG